MTGESRTRRNFWNTVLTPPTSGTDFSTVSLAGAWWPVGVALMGSIGLAAYDKEVPESIVAIGSAALVAWWAC